MQPNPRGILTFLLLGLLAGTAVAQQQELTWPREIKTEKALITIYQPQIDALEGDKLTARAAVSVKLEDRESPVFGAALFSARIHTDRENRLVTLENIDVAEANFPGATEENLEKFREVVRKSFLGEGAVVSLDRLTTGIEMAEKEKTATFALKHDPPKIIYADKPTLLVTISGEPQLEGEEGEGPALKRVVNTPFYILFDTGTNAYYLLGGGYWYTAKEVTGEWREAAPAPAAVRSHAAADENAPQSEGAKLDVKPAIVVATEPTELLQSDGPPRFGTLGETGLLYVKNTESDLFLDSSGETYYVLLSGRWFSTDNLQTGEWKFVRPNKLPAAFAEIPDDSEKARVRASVAGTEEAEEAVKDTRIPQTAAVSRAEAKLVVVYDGAPKFEPVEDTTFEYAVNTAFAVFRVEGRYYCCHEAVWFVADRPNGPWSVCDDVPDELYTITPENPHYNVRYVHVYDSDDDVVYMGYYPGYMGSYVYYGCVWYGTGWYYRPWWRRWYYPRAVTYGFAARYDPMRAGWGFGIGYRGPKGWIGVGARGATAAWIGGRARAGAAWFGPAGYRRNDIDLRVDERAAAAARSSNLYHGRAGVNRTRDRFADRAAARPRPAAAPAAGLERNNVYAGKDGGVYRRTEAGWQKRENAGWTDARDLKAPAPGKPAYDRQSLEREYHHRQRGATRTYHYGSYRSTGRRSYYGGRGGFRGGGRRR